MALSSDAPATLPCFVGAVSRHPKLLLMNLGQAEELCKSLDGDQSTYNSVKNVLLGHAAKLPAMEKIQKTYTQVDDYSGDVSFASVFREEPSREEGMVTTFI